ncbi:MAG: winged helix-turn-helix transcriptional regulator [Promethearchaeota archaeon]|nr:MAG: winged helix-turn-helix transcriptional regulator [Candidatus Lokiarchaeota archaeon]
MSAQIFYNDTRITQISDKHSHRARLLQHLFRFIFFVSIYIILTSQLISFINSFLSDNKQPTLLNPFTALCIMSTSVFFLESDVETLQNLFFHYLPPKEPTQHRLSLGEVLENENRIKILDLIISDPGIHFNQLLSQSGLFPGQLQWHLRILREYGFLLEKKVERYVVYYSVIDQVDRTNAASNYFVLQKSKMTFKVLEIIEAQPSICSSQLASCLDLKRNSVKYHIDKLLRKGYLVIHREGRKNLLFIKEEAQG